jgi:hypothetical protein
MAMPTPAPILDSLKLLQEQLEETVTLMSRANGSPSVAVLKSLAQLEDHLVLASGEVKAGRKELKRNLISEVKGL